MAIILVHGGASNRTATVENTLKQETTEATCAALTQPAQSALDWVEAAVVSQELAAAVNAGIGSVLQLDGRIRMDAAICDSSSRYGAVIQLEQVSTPVKVARRILDLGYHSILSGEGAQQFAREQGFPAHSPYTPKAFEEFQQARQKYPELRYVTIASSRDEINLKKLSTVGAVALDDKGGLAAACSTGGTSFCYPGRVGDTPIFGAGLYCSPHVAVACTGEGDKVLRRLTARRVEDGFLQHGSLQKAADDAIADLLEHTKGYAGLIALAHTGETATAHSTAFMAWASRKF